MSLVQCSAVQGDAADWVWCRIGVVYWIVGGWYDAVYCIVVCVGVW